MNNKKAIKLGFIGTTFVAIGLAIAVVANNIGSTNIFRARGIEHDANCEWNHYDAVEATYVQHGSKEFWACCTHAGQHVLVEPGEGHITNVGAWTGEAFEAIDDSDDRYVPQLEGNNFLRVHVDNSNSTAPVRSKTMVSGVTGISFKYRMTNVSAHHWFGFALNTSENPNVYPYDGESNPTVVDWQVLTQSVFDGDWHLAKLSLAGTGYLAFAYAAGDFGNGSGAIIDIDDVEIATSAYGTIKIDFSDMSQFLIRTEYAEATGEPIQNNFLRLSGKTYGGFPDQGLAMTKQQYTDVTAVSFRARLSGNYGAGKSENEWFGVSIKSNGSDPDSYSDTGDHTNSGVNWRTSSISGTTNLDGVWRQYNLTGLNASGYVVLVQAGHLDVDSTIDFDDVVITYDGGKTVTEDFSFYNKDLLFKNNDHASYGLMFGIASAPLGVVSDAEKASFDLVNYANKNTIVENAYHDPVHGWCHEVSDLHGYDQIWIGFKETSSKSQAEAELGGTVGKYYFDVYNFGSNNLTIELRHRNGSYGAIRNVTFTAGEWTRIEVSVGEVDPGKPSAIITNPGDIGLGKWVGGSVDNQVTIVGDTNNLMISSLYAKLADAAPAVDPAPFGVVALDAQTGYFRDLKGYNAPHTDSHGIDNDYGAYIQIDDWRCPDNANQCWITFSNTARDVADIETDLGSSITNYFFYIYNPLADSFTFKIMLTSSSGMNPNMNVACAAGAWTKVTIAYGHADNGSYPALTSASQIGLTQVLGNSAVVGSGWKVTSVYAE